MKEIIKRIKALVKNNLTHSKKNIAFGIVLSIGIFFGINTFAANPTQSLGFQGQLFSNNTPLSSSVNATFTFYDAVTGGSVTGSPIAKTVTVSNGYFGTEFSESDTTGVDFNQQLYLEVTINGTTLSPRTSVNSSVSSLKSFGTFTYANAPVVGPAGSLYFNSSLNALFVSNGTVWVTASIATSTLLGIANGGTGATTTVVARENLGIFFATSSDIVLNTNISAWGDSLTFGAGGGTTTYPTVLAQLSGYTVYNGGIGGETSTQIRTRMLAASGRYSHATIIWAGRNNFNNPTQVKDDIAAMVSALTAVGNNNYIILSILNASSSTEISGQSSYNQIVSLNNDLATIYGSHYLDIRSYLVSQYDPGIPQDVINFSNDVIPSSLRSDVLHLNAAGYAKVANYIYANFSLLTPSSKLLTTENIKSLYFPKLGIGTSAPAAQFEVFGGDAQNTSIFISNTVVNSTSSELALVFRQDVGDSVNGGFGAGGKIVSGREGLYGGSIFSHQSNLQFYVSTSGVDGEALRITSGKNIGIGTTTPIARLDLVGTPTNNLNTLMQLSSQNAAGVVSSKFSFLSDGSFGLGTTTPTVRLDVVGGATNNIITLAKFTSISAIGTPTQRFTFMSDGNFGIGTTTPETRLHILSASSVTTLGQLGANVRLQTTSVTSGAGGEISFRGIATTTDTAIYAAISAPITSNTTNGTLGYISFSTKPSTAANSLTEVMRLTSSGLVGIGTSTPTQALVASGTIQSTALLGGATTLSTDANGNIIRTPSDQKLKTNVETLTSALDKVNQMRGVSYNWIDTERFGPDKEIGFIAQELETIVPEVVKSGGEYKSVNYQNLVALLVEAIKELSTKVEGFAASFTTKFIRADKIETNDINTKKLCIEDICVTKQQLIRVLQESGENPEPQPSVSTPSGEETVVSTSTPETVETVSEVDPIVEIPPTVSGSEPITQ